MSFQHLADLENALRSGCLTVRELYSVWDQRLPVIDPHAARKNGAVSDSQGRQIDWLRERPHLVSRFTRYALEADEFRLVCDCATEALWLWEQAGEQERLELVRVRMNYALALARLGDTGRARRELEPCLDGDYPVKIPRELEIEILLELGHILRAESHDAGTLPAQLQAAGQALDFYTRVLALEPENLVALSSSAAVAFNAGEPGSALRERATREAGLVLHRVRDTEGKNGVTLHTVDMRAVAQAVLGDVDAAAASYGELAGLPGATAASLATARYWSQTFAEGLGKDQKFFYPAFPPLQLVVFSGHLPDLPGQTPRFPPYAVPAARETIEAALHSHRVLAGMCGASAGADLLFLDALRRRGGTAHVVLPWERREFRRTNITPFESVGGESWEILFNAALDSAATVREIGQSYRSESGVGFEYQLEVMAGLALQASRASRLDLQPMVLWDEKMTRSLGGTDAFVDFWQRRFGLRPIVLRLPPVATEAPVVIGGIDSAGPADDHAGLPAPRCEHAIFRQEVKSMLFADIVGYSKLNESVIPEFINHFLARLSRTVSESRYAPLHVNTWGDALYAVFDYAHDAGCFALEFTKLIHEGRDDWLAQGLYWEETDVHGQPLRDPAGNPIRHPLNIRVGLHTGPVFMHYNPVIRQLGFTGVHVSRAARIEPVTTPGEVFASEEFAALAETDARSSRPAGGLGGDAVSGGFICEYAGTRMLAKGYPGRHRIYRLVPKKAFAIEELAAAIHARYIAAAIESGRTPPGSNGELRPWEELAPDLKQANFAQAADIPNKLRVLGYELTPGHGLKALEIPLTHDKIEAMAIHEHDRWAQERERQGWKYGAVRDNARKHHPLLVPWEALDETEREKDRATVKNLPWLVEQAGFRVRKLNAA